MALAPGTSPVTIDLDRNDMLGVDANVILSLSTSSVHVTIDIPRGDLHKFHGVAGRRWVDGAIAIGSCAGA